MGVLQLRGHPAALMGPCSQTVLRGILETAKHTYSARTRVGEAICNPGLWALQTPQPFPLAVGQGPNHIGNSGQVSLNAVSEKCNTIN